MASGPARTSLFAVGWLLAAAAFFSFLLWARPTAITRWTAQSGDLTLVVTVGSSTATVGEPFTFTLKATSRSTPIGRITMDVAGHGGFSQVNDFARDACQHQPFGFTKSYEHVFTSDLVGTGKPFRVAVSGEECGSHVAQHVEVRGAISVVPERFVGSYTPLCGLPGTPQCAEGNP